MTDQTANRLADILARCVEAFERAEAREMITLSEFVLEESVCVSINTVFGYLKEFGLPYRGGPTAKAVKISRACGRRLLAHVPSLRAQTGQEPRR